MYSHSTNHTAQMTCVHGSSLSCVPKIGHSSTRLVSPCFSQYIKHQHKFSLIYLHLLCHCRPLLRNQDLLSTHPVIHCEDPRQDGTSTEFHPSTVSRNGHRRKLGTWPMVFILFLNLLTLQMVQQQALTKSGRVWFNKLRTENRAITIYRRINNSSSELVYTGELIQGWNGDFAALWVEATDEANLRNRSYQRRHGVLASVCSGGT